ncbi:hypothetical protein AK88_05596, partial [Plasmodium fragile]
MKVYYFMDGIGNARTGHSAATQPEDQIHPFMRCMVGHVILAKQFARQCDFNTLVPYAREATDGMRTLAKVDTSNTACNGLDFDTLQIGHKLVGKTIQAWIEEKRSDWKAIMEDYMDHTCDAHTRIEAGGHSGQDTHEETEPQGAQGNISPNDLKKLAASTDELSKDEATEVLIQIKDEKDANNILRKLQEGLQ